MVKLRQNTPAWRAAQLRQTGRCDAMRCRRSTETPIPATSGGGANNFAIYAPSVAAANFSQTAAPAGTIVVVPAANTATTMTAILARGPNDSAALIPASMPGVGYANRPLDFALTDARAAPSRRWPVIRRPTERAATPSSS